MTLFATICYNNVKFIEKIFEIKGFSFSCFMTGDNWRIDEGDG